MSKRINDPASSTEQEPSRPQTLLECSTVQSVKREASTHSFHTDLAPYSGSLEVLIEEVSSPRFDLPLRPGERPSLVTNQELSVAESNETTNPTFELIDSLANTPELSDFAASPPSGCPSHGSEPDAAPISLQAEDSNDPARCRDPWSKMSGYYYHLPNDDQEDEQQQSRQQPQQRYPMHYQQQSMPVYNPANVAFTSYAMSANTAAYASQPQRYAVDPQTLLAQQQQYQYQNTLVNPTSQQSWTLPSSPPTTYDFQTYQQPSLNYATTFPLMSQNLATTAPGYLSPPAIAGPSRPRPARTVSNASRASSVSYNTDNSRGESPSAAEMARWGTRNADGTWSCSHRGCTSRSTFTRGCDLRKHYKRHTKTLFCRYEDCPQATRGGFSSNKDRTRHEQKHNPNILCEWEGCGRKFSRVDNMKDHVRRVHLK